jgi:hypothetical protein
MIQMIEGKIGGGKSYTAMGWICNHLAKGGVVATNINIQLDEFEDQYGKKRGLRWALKRHYNYEVQDCQYIHLSDVETVDYITKKGVTQLNQIVMFYKIVPRGTPDMPLLVVIDEAHLHFPNDGYRTIPREVLNFLTLSRHACVDIVFISQHVKNMWCQMTRLSEYRWAVRDMKKFGIPVSMFNVPWPFPHYLKNKFDSDGTVMAREMEWARPFLYETYRSPEIAASFESMEQASSVTVKKGKMTVRDKITLIGMGLVAGIAIMAVPACKSSKSESASIEAKVTEEEAFKSVSKKGFIERISSANQSEEIESPEYFKGYFDSGWDSRLYTTKRRYLIGDIVDGMAVVKVGRGKLTLFDMETKEFGEKNFPSEPKEIALERLRVPSAQELN